MSIASQRVATISIVEDIHSLVWDDRLYGRGAFGRLLASALRYLFALLRDIASGQLTMRAMSLVYTTLLSVVPLLAFSFAILKGLGVFEQLQPYLTSVLAPLGEQGEVITQQILTLVNNVRGSVLGGLGLVFFLYTAISMVQKVEEAFNYVWYVSKPRSFAVRFFEYLVVLLVGPMLMVAAIGLITSIQSNEVVQYIITNPQLGPVFVLIGKLAPYLLISGVFTFLYMFMPNTSVSFGAALVGGICGGIMWATLGAVFTTFVLYSARTLQIYAGFAVAVTTLLWLYLNWLVLLVGAQIAFYRQRPAFLRIGRREPRLSNAMRERLALNVMYLAGRAYRSKGGPLTFGQLSQKLAIPTLGLTPVVSALEDAGLLIITDKEELLSGKGQEGLIPGREMATISLKEILDVVRARGETGAEKAPTWSAEIESLGTTLDAAADAAIGSKTLSALVAGKASEDKEADND